MMLGGGDAIPAFGMGNTKKYEERGKKIRSQKSNVKFFFIEKRRAEKRRRGREGEEKEKRRERTISLLLLLQY